MALAGSNRSCLIAGNIKPFQGDELRVAGPGTHEDDAFAVPAPRGRHGGRVESGGPRGTAPAGSPPTADIASMAVSRIVRPMSRFLAADTLMRLHS